MAAVFQTTFWNGLSWMKLYEFRLKCNLTHICVTRAQWVIHCVNKEGACYPYWHHSCHISREESCKNVNAEHTRNDNHIRILYQFNFKLTSITKFENILYIKLQCGMLYSYRDYSERHLIRNVLIAGLLKNIFPTRNTPTARTSAAPCFGSVKQSIQSETI